MTHRIVNVKALDDFVVRVIFQNGVEKHYDIKNLFDEYYVFRQLAENVELYQKVQVDVGGYGISWNDEMDLSAEEIWENGIKLECLILEVLLLLIFLHKIFLGSRRH